MHSIPKRTNDRHLTSQFLFSLRLEKVTDPALGRPGHFHRVQPNDSVLQADRQGRTLLQGAPRGSGGGGGGCRGRRCTDHDGDSGHHKVRSGREPNGIVCEMYEGDESAERLSHVLPERGRRGRLVSRLCVLWNSVDSSPQPASQPSS